jgi:Domain of unknown function (DUF2024)
MKVAVWDTYVKQKNGNVLHFDIIVPESTKDAALIYNYGNAYLISKNENDGILATEECQLCHVEEPNDEMLSAIKQKGYHILEMEEIPSILPNNPTRREMILYLRAHNPQCRFANFRGVNDAEILTMLHEKY